MEAVEAVEAVGAVEAEAVEAEAVAVEAARSSTRGGGGAPRDRVFPLGVPSLQPQGTLRIRWRRARAGALQRGGAFEHAAATSTSHPCGSVLSLRPCSRRRRRWCR